MRSSELARAAPASIIIQNATNAGHSGQQFASDRQEEGRGNSALRGGGEWTGAMFFFQTLNLNAPEESVCRPFSNCRIASQERIKQFRPFCFANTMIARRKRTQNMKEA